MPRTQNDAGAIGVTRAVVGLSAAVQVAPIPYQGWVEIGLISGGTLFMHGSTVVAAGVTFGRPFLAANGNDHFNIWGGPTNLYLHAAGATCVAHVVYYLTQVP